MKGVRKGFGGRKEKGGGEVTGCIGRGNTRGSHTYFICLFLLFISIGHIGFPVNLFRIRICNWILDFVPAVLNQRMLII